MAGPVMSTSARLLFSSCCAMAIMSAPGAAYAQEVADSPAVDADEIVVTARLREESLQDVPISVQVLAQEQMAEQNLNTLYAVSESVPSIHVGASARSNELYIRGIGSGYNQSFDQSVGTFIDGIYHGRSRAAASTFLDLDRVEILKGPQSIFFGNNAIAGALNIVTKKPRDVAEGWARLLYAPDAKQYVAESAFGLPLSETLSIRAALAANGQDGWLRNVATGQTEPKEDNVAGRLSLRFAPSDAFDLTLKVEGSDNKNSGAVALQPVNCPAPAPYTTGGFCAVVAPFGFTGIGDDRIAENSGQKIRYQTEEYVLTGNYSFEDSAITSITGFNKYDFFLNLDVDSTPNRLLTAQVPEDYKQFSQELRISSSSDGPIEYVGGVYYQVDDLNYHSEVNYFFQNGRIAGTPALAPLAPFLPFGQVSEFDLHSETMSAFGSLTWNISDLLSLTGGLRFSRVKRDFDWFLFHGTATADYGGIVQLPGALAPLASSIGLGVAGTVKASRKDNGLMPSLTAEYEFSSDVKGYASYTRGFKAGGFNGAETSANPVNYAFEPEYVDAYEVGIKTKIFDNRVILNMALFRSDYKDLQVVANIPTMANVLSLVRNAAESTSQGVEVEGSWNATDNLRVSTNVTYLDSQYDNYTNAGPTSLQQLGGIRIQDLSGERTQFAPRWSGNVTANWDLALPGGYVLSSELRQLFSSSYYLTAANDPLLQQNAYGRLDARLTLLTPGEKWAFDIIAKNLTDKNIATLGTAWPTSIGSVQIARQQGSNVAFQVRVKW